MAGVAEVLRIRVKAVTASFRQPFIMIGRLPTFEMPPPATIYGHLCGVLGEWFDPSGLEFAYTFTHHGVGEDVELGQMIEVSSGRNDIAPGGLPRNVEGSLNPQRRQFLLNPEMTLYLRGPRGLLERLHARFLSPAFAYVLGRSQDLATCLKAEWTGLEPSSGAFFSHTLLPWSLRPWVVPGEPVYMPCAINYRRLREPVFERYLQLRDRPLRVFGSGVEEDITDTSLFADMLVDPSEMRTFLGRELSRGVWFHPVRGMGDI